MNELRESVLLGRDGRERTGKLEAALRAYFALDGLRPQGLVAAYMFGSHARGRAHRESDLDVAVLLTHGVYRAMSAPGEFRVSLISDLIAATHDNSIDLVLMNQAPPPLNKAILDEGVPLVVVDPEQLASFRTISFSRAAELRPWLDRYHRERMQVLAGVRAHP
jgi:uncharacterized protein